MKKIIALLLAIMMILSFTAIVSADGTAAEEASAAIAAIGNYVVYGGIERKALIDTARAKVNALSEKEQTAIAKDIKTLEDYENKYKTATSNGTLTEVSLKGNATVTEFGTYKKSTDEFVKNFTGHGWREMLVDGKVTNKTENGTSNVTYVAGDWSLTEITKNEDGTDTRAYNSDYYGRITLELNSEEKLSGIRVYTRKDDNRATYQLTAAAKDVVIEAYDNDGNVYKAANVAEPYIAKTPGTGNTTTLPEYTDVDYAYLDYNIDKTLTGVKKIVIKYNSMWDKNNPHWGAEEIRLLSDTKKTEYSIVDIVTQSAVEAIDAVAEYPVYGGIERVKLIAEAEAKIAKLTASQKESIQEKITEFNDYKSLKDASLAKVSELNTVGNMKATEVATYTTADNTFFENRGNNNNLLTDGTVTKSTDPGQSGVNFDGIDWALKDTTGNFYLKIKLSFTTPETLSGIRFYARKGDKGTWYFTDGNASQATFELYDNSGKCYKTGVLLPRTSIDNVFAEAAVVNDFAFANADGAFAVTDASQIVINIPKLYNNNIHFGAEEIRAIKHTGAVEKSVADLKNDELKDEAQTAVLAINAIDSRVTGSVEEKKGIAAARAAYDALSDEAKAAVTNYGTLTEIESAYNASSVKEIEADLTGSAHSDHRASHDHSDLGYNNGGTEDGVYSTTNLFDNKISAENVLGKDSAFMRGDFSVFGRANEYLYITINTESVGSFSGIRLYTRKRDKETTYDAGAVPSKVKVALYSSDTVYVSTGIVVPTVKTGTNGKENMYYDIPLTFNGETVKCTGITKIVLTLTELKGDNKWGAFGAEELRLLDDETVTETKTVSDIAETLVTLSTPTFESGVYDNGTGIIRFFTTFESIADGTEIESFGTYAQGDSVSKENTCATYEGVTPKVNDNFSVDVKNIPAGYFDKPVFALSFVKIKGYNNLIISGTSTGAKVNAKNKLK